MVSSFSWQDEPDPVMRCLPEGQDDTILPTCDYQLCPTGKYVFFPYIEDITRWHEDMNFIFEWQNNILRTSAASE